MIPNDLFWIVGETGGPIIFFVKVGDRDEAVARKWPDVLKAGEHWHDPWKGMLGSYSFS